MSVRCGNPGEDSSERRYWIVHQRSARVNKVRVGIALMQQTCSVADDAKDGTSQLSFREPLATGVQERTHGRFARF